MSCFIYRGTEPLHKVVHACSSAIETSRGSGCVRNLVADPFWLDSVHTPLDAPNSLDIILQRPILPGFLYG